MLLRRSTEVIDMGRAGAPQAGRKLCRNNFEKGIVAVSDMYYPTSNRSAALYLEVSQLAQLSECSVKSGRGLFFAG